MRIGMLETKQTARQQRCRERKSVRKRGGRSGQEEQEAGKKGGWEEKGDREEMNGRKALGEREKGEKREVRKRRKVREKRDVRKKRRAEFPHAAALCRRRGNALRPHKRPDRTARDAALFFLVRLLARGCSLAGSILLGRELDPSSFGLFSMAGAICAIPDAIGTLGLSDALAAAPRRDPRREQEITVTAFWWMLLGETCMVLLLFLLAPLPAIWLQEKNLTCLLRLSSLSLLSTPFLRILSVQVQRSRIRTEGRKPKGGEEGKEEGEQHEGTNREEERGQEEGSARKEGRKRKEDTAVQQQEGRERKPVDTRGGEPQPGGKGERYGNAAPDPKREEAERAEPEPQREDPEGAEPGLQGEEAAGTGKDPQREKGRGADPGRTDARRGPSLYRRYLLSTLPGTLPALIAGLCLWKLGRAGKARAVDAAEGAQLLVLLALLRTFLDAILGWTSTGWKPCPLRKRAGSRDTREKPKERKGRRTLSLWRTRRARRRQRDWKRQRRKRRILRDPEITVLFQDGRNLLLASLLDTACGNLRVFLLGASCTSTELAFYTRGRQIPELLAKDLALSLSFVLLPLFSEAGRQAVGEKEDGEMEEEEIGDGEKEKHHAAESRGQEGTEQEEGRELGKGRELEKGGEQGKGREQKTDRASASPRTVLLAGIRKASLAAFPALAVLAGIADRLVPALFGAHWEGMSFYLSLACISCALYPIHALNGTALRGLGETRVFFCLEGKKKIFSLLLLLPALFSPEGQAGKILAVTDLAAALLALPLNTAPLKNRIGVRTGDELRAMCPALLLSLFLGGTLYLLGRGGR